jgi:hypothetical protein
MGFTVKTKIETAGINRMLRMMEEARNVSGKTTEEIVVKHTGELGKNLAKRCAEIAKPAAYYDSLPATLFASGKGFRRPSDSQRGTNFTSIKKEIQMRKASRKYLASCWLQFRKTGSGKLVPIIKNRGEIRVVWPDGPGQKGSVTLINKARKKRLSELIASQVHQKFGIVNKAVNDTTRNMIPYIRRKRGEAIKIVKGTK